MNKEKDIQHIDWIESWVAGKLEGADLIAFEQERAQNPDFAAQCALAAALHERGHQRRKQQFKQNLDRIEAELAAEGFEHKQQSADQSAVKLPEKEQFRAQLKQIEAALEEEGVIEKKIAPTMRPLSTWKVWRRQLMAAAAVLTTLVAAIFYMSKEDPTKLYMIAQEQVNQPPFSNPYYQAGKKGMIPNKETILDSLLHFRKYIEVEKLLDSPSTTEKYQRFWWAVSLLHNSQKSGDERAAKAVKLLETLAEEDEFKSNSALMVKSQLALAYLKMGKDRKAKALLKDLAYSGETEYMAFANTLKQKINK